MPGVLNGRPSDARAPEAQVASCAKRRLDLDFNPEILKKIASFGRKSAALVREFILVCLILGSIKIEKYMNKQPLKAL